MNPMKDFTLCLLGLSLAGSTPALSQQRDRSKVPDQYKWNLADIYPSDDAWKTAKEKLGARIGAIAGYQGKLADSPQSLLACLDLLADINKEFARIYTYAQLHSDLDTREAPAMAAVQEARQVGSTLAAQSAFIQPEVLAMDRPKVDAFLAAEPKLGIYRHLLDDILRRKAHTGTAGEEKIVADASLMSDAPGSTYTIFSNADFPFPEITLSDGTKVRMDKAAFALYRAVPNREDRRKVFDEFFGKIDDYRRTFGASLYAEVKKDMFYMKAEKYGSCLESALDGSNIPVEVYKALVNNMDANLATFHRYLNLRRRMLGVDQLHYYDLYVPVVTGVDLNYTIDESEKTILDALKPLGDDYVAVAKKAFASRWVDVYPNTGKVSGAYSNGDAYDVHPYMLLNYNGKYDDMSTLAHELGHTLHSYLANSSQPYVNASYSTFVAEVASTFNEALLMDHMLKTVKDDKVRLSLLFNYLDGIKGTLIRQIQFAEFEMRIHETAEKGESLTGDGLDALYRDITRRYYGHDKGVCIVDSTVQAEWAYIPHFYYNFYVFQYATSITASSALSEEVLAGDKEARTRYLAMLKSGGSDYPIALLKKAGVDMTTSQPFDLLIKKMNRIMDEVEVILKKEGK